MKFEEYIDQLIDNNLDMHHWFVTKQTMRNFYFPFYVAEIVDKYPIEHTINQNFAKYYSYKFKSNDETKELFPNQFEGENTYRNAIIAEFLGLINRTSSRYDQAQVTDAYNILKKYISCNSDVEKYRDIVDRQIEKMCFNVITSARKYEEVKTVTIFPVIFLYKILLLLYETYGDSTLTHDEFATFIMRTRNYDDYETVLELIKEYRKHEYAIEYDGKIRSIINHVSTKNVRFDALFGSLKHIEYESSSYYKINNDKASFEYLQKVVKSYESSMISKETNKEKLKEFMQSSNYFNGTLENPEYDLVMSDYEFTELIKTADVYYDEIERLAKKYGLSGTTTVTSEVRLPSVQQAFRDKLIHRDGQKCIMCDVSNKELLVASHIKDASVCTIYEKADMNNGLLLCAGHDKLFDKFLITFDFMDGNIKISKTLTQKEKEIFSLDENFCLPDYILTDECQDYLIWHNETFYKKEEER